MKTTPLPTSLDALGSLDIQSYLTALESVISAHEEEFLSLFRFQRHLTFTGEVAFCQNGVMAVFWLGEDGEMCHGYVEWPSFLDFYNKHA